MTKNIDINPKIKAYKRLERTFKSIGKLGVEGISQRIWWDEQIAMPESGADTKSEHRAALSLIKHDVLTNPKLNAYLDEAEDNRSELDPWQDRNLTLMRRRWLRVTAIESDLVEEFSKATSHCMTIWRQAKDDNDFDSYEPAQQKLLDLAIQAAQAVGEKMGVSPYEAMLDRFDIGRTTKEIDAIFAESSAFLPDFIEEVIEKQKSYDPIPIDDEIDPDLQLHAIRTLLEKMGYDFSAGRIDIGNTASHNGLPGDSRIITRVNSSNILRIFNSTMHELGHALYSQGIPEEWSSQLVGCALGMTINESQAIFMERRIFRSRRFLDYAVPVICDALGGKSGKKWETENIFQLITKVEPKLIRAGSDEITYHAHIILRYEIEKRLFSGDLKFKDVPAVWKELLEKLLPSVEVTDYTTGCMQDTHWAKGSFGYFPTYALGDIASIQFFNKAEEDIPELRDLNKEGNFKPLFNWLKDEVHSHGSRYTPDQLLKKVTGSVLNPEIFKDYYRKKYIDMYDCAGSESGTQECSA